MWSRKILIIPFALLFLTGCGVVSSNNPELFSGTRDYEMKIIKSEVNINTVEFVAEKNLSVKNLLEQSGVEYKMRGDGRLTELDGVIATASKEWGLYIDNIKSDLDATVCNKCELIWKYESLTN
ncbi:MAG: hypothetical protein ABIJ23_00570 [Candidatus Magasanikbacteria bacterium]